MTPSDQEFDKSEAATPYKLEEARKRGTVGRSVELIAALVFVVAVAYVHARGWSTVLAQFRFDQALLLQAGQGALSGPRLWLLLHTMLVDTLQLFAPFLLTLMIAAVLGNLVQNRPGFTFKPLVPDWKRINPATGLRRLFSLRTLYEGLRTVLKSVLLLLVIWFALKELSRQFYEVAALPAGALLQRWIADAAVLGMRVALLLAILALIDLAWTRRRFAREMRMSRRDLRDEIKHREGDPRIRARLRQLRIEALKRTLAARRTGDGDVLITNPTHIAVSLRYRHGEMAAPVMVAKGAGMLAAVMRALAARHIIPVVRSPALARELYRQVEPGVAVPAELYAPVARILVWVLAMRDARGAREDCEAHAARAPHRANATHGADALAQGAPA